ncbi:MULTISPECIES: TlpA disulfide reductase family protein [unclassified Streptomyces]|uniref:TlpA family protein disulfide reductase n=1 Tax=unclassified Streptomyces TaxID=2593676 RepID=UPI00224C964C|nr:MULTISPECIES: TlpA disulfide reductase family protein [unclassified Streptomyces]MCX5332306.1 TlpA family protein disulfide reductase [Streptomyces sp. NBC_00140]MCX5361684.1 TlpA family protein disulfide reductase [Streptomyces sp. NBC_00124]
MSALTRTNRRAVLFTATAAAAALTLTACSSGGKVGGSGDTNFITGNDGVDTASEGKRDAAPVLSGKTIDGEQLSTADYKGKVLVVNVWGSWCTPCRAEAKNLQAVSEKLKGQGVQFVGINTRDTNTTSAINFEKEFGVTFPSLYDPTGKQMLRFKKGTLNPQLIPSTLVIDRSGKIAARALMALSEETLTGMIKPVLAEK